MKLEENQKWDILDFSFDPVWGASRWRPSEFGYFPPSHPTLYLLTHRSVNTSTRKATTRTHSPYSGYSGPLSPPNSAHLSRTNDKHFRSCRSIRSPLVLFSHSLPPDLSITQRIHLASIFRKPTEIGSPWTSKYFHSCILNTQSLRQTNQPRRAGSVTSQRSFTSDDSLQFSILEPFAPVY